jgi:hypothetical protein
MPPQVIDLTPCVGLLTDGQPHTISLRVAHDGFYWGIGSDLLLYRDPALAHTTGAQDLTQELKVQGSISCRAACATKSAARP